MDWRTLKAKLTPEILFWILAAILFIIMVSLHKDYGLTNDEPIHQAHGEVVLDYFMNQEKTAQQLVLTLKRTLNILLTLAQ